MVGMIDASTTDKPTTPCTSLPSPTTVIGAVPGPIYGDQGFVRPHTPEGVDRGRDMVVIATASQGSPLNRL
jgi:hypothetical protein